MALIRPKNIPQANITNLNSSLSSKIESVSIDNLPAGTVIQTLQSPMVGGGNGSSTHFTVSTSNYSNNRATYLAVGSAYNLTVTTKKANSRFIIFGAVQLNGTGTSHKYYDLFIRHGSTGQGYLSLLCEGASGTEDGLIANHVSTSADIYKEAFNVEYSPSLAAGSTITLEPYIANWSGQTSWIGGYTNVSNNNANNQAGFTVLEIAG